MSNSKVNIDLVLLVEILIFFCFLLFSFFALSIYLHTDVVVRDDLYQGSYSAALRDGRVALLWLYRPLQSLFLNDYNTKSLAIILLAFTQSALAYRFLRETCSNIFKRVIGGVFFVLVLGAFHLLLRYGNGVWYILGAVFFTWVTFETWLQQLSLERLSARMSWLVVSAFSAVMVFFNYQAFLFFPFLLISIHYLSRHDGFSWDKEFVAFICMAGIYVVIMIICMSVYRSDFYRSEFGADINRGLGFLELKGQGFADVVAVLFEKKLSLLHRVGSVVNSTVLSSLFLVVLYLRYKSGRPVGLYLVFFLLVVVLISFNPLLIFNNDLNFRAHAGLQLVTLLSVVLLIILVFPERRIKFDWLTLKLILLVMISFWVFGFYIDESFPEYSDHYWGELSALSALIVFFYCCVFILLRRHDFYYFCLVVLASIVLMMVVEAKNSIDRVKLESRVDQDIAHKIIQKVLDLKYSSGGKKVRLKIGVTSRYKRYYYSSLSDYPRVDYLRHQMVVYKGVSIEGDGGACKKREHSEYYKIYELPKNMLLVCF